MVLKRFKPYFAYLKEVRVKFAVGLLAGILSAAASGAGLPFVIKVLVPLVTSDDAPTGMALAGILLTIPVVFLFRAGGTYLNEYYMAHSGMHVLEKVRLSVFDKLQSLPLAFFQKNQTGDLMIRVMGDAQTLQTAIISSVNSLVRQPATLLFAIAFLVGLAIHSEETFFLLIALMSVPCCVFPIRLIGRKILKKATQAQQEAGRVNSVLNENLGATREVRAYNLQKRESIRFGEACRAFFKYSLKTVKYDKALTPMIELVTALVIPIAFYVTIVKEIKPEDIAAILTALYMCYEPVKKLGKVSNTLRKAEASLNRLEYILHSEDSVPEAPDPKQLERVKGRIDFSGVNFAYDDELVLRKINACIPAGESVALVGPSGAGKSTFANLVPRFYDVTDGSIMIDGQDVRTLRKADLRQQVALVSQEAVLFGESIAENIRIGNPSATDEEIRAASKMAQAHEFIEALEDGYGTQVGERGSRLSGGQRQRISIARAFLKDAPIIILDEPTSALDAESEHEIQIALEELSRGRTVIIIAHRFSTIQHADRILVFNAGEIIASGTHSELYESNKLYRSLYNKQSQTKLQN
ncbi:ABC transporter ATP-binding protein [Coraliomargarita sinensis]|uniref:ABC transporter ATP-binding protein n=1 Tax=Coraliomargarita sinensis TaxID=2174842 RepID=A0A317ZLR1_9BACT|nr:ABC transporter ATP-binding protein [Coraliomargarita sinensis]PXA04759.1 ABC transporter ATP-binding protein [Coraliomargarita sinensis]